MHWEVAVLEFGHEPLHIPGQVEAARLRVSRGGLARKLAAQASTMSTAPAANTIHAVASVALGLVGVLALGMGTGWPDAAASLWTASSAVSAESGAGSWGREVGERGSLDGVGSVELVEPEGVGHDDEQRPVVDEPELLAEELGVALWRSPQCRDRAEVGRRGDQRDAYRVARADCGLQQCGELCLLVGGDAGVLGEEQALLGKDIAGGIAVGERHG